MGSFMFQSLINGSQEVPILLSHMESANSPFSYFTFVQENTTGMILYTWQVLFIVYHTSDL